MISLDIERGKRPFEKSRKLENQIIYKIQRENMSFPGDKSVYKLLNDSLIWSKEVGVSNISLQILKWQEGQLGKLDDLLLQGRNTQNHSNKKYETELKYLVTWGR